MDGVSPIMNGWISLFVKEIKLPGHGFQRFAGNFLRNVNHFAYFLHPGAGVRQ